MADLVPAAAAVAVATLVTQAQAQEVQVATVVTQAQVLADLEALEAVVPAVQVAMSVTQALAAQQVEPAALPQQIQALPATPAWA